MNVSMRYKSIPAVLVAVLAAAAPSFVHAAQIYLDPATGTYPLGLTFEVDVRLDNAGQCINAASVDIAYPKDLLQPVAVSDGDSILSLWVKEPTIYSNYGIISFVGGLPGGYCGRVAGDANLSNKLATLYFQFPTSTVVTSSSIPQTATISIVSSTQVVLNDGNGTLAPLTLAGASYTQLLKGQYAPENAWEDNIQSDTIPPEPFTVGVYKDPSLFNDQLFAVFSTVDKQTGVDHYDVAEVPTADIGKPEDQLNWVRAVSPYLIQNQNLDGLIEVRAVDKAGNERIATYSTQKLPATPSWKLRIFAYLAVISLGGLSLIQIIIRFIL